MSYKVNFPGVSFHVVVRMQILAIFFIPSLAWAVDTTVLSDEFNGLGPKIAKLQGSCPDSSEQLIYQQISPLTVSSSGAYAVADAFNNFAPSGDATVAIYQGAFNPANVQQNLVAPSGFDDWETVQLTAGVEYTLVVQPWCYNIENAWAVTISGPGTVSSAKVAHDLPDFTHGSFSDSDPLITTDCGTTQYHQSGPIQVARPGFYFFVDISHRNAVDICLSIYSGPPDPLNPQVNLIGTTDLDGWIHMAPGQDYYFIVQPNATAATGDYFFLLTPPASFRLNAGLNGSWKNAATTGQGFFLDVFGDIGQIFLAWFTYDLERPMGSVMAHMGDPGHRWLTAFGPFSWNSANLEIEWTEGGVFDSATPHPMQTVDGSILLEFTGCNSGTVTYDLGTVNASGVVPIQRIANDNVALCESLAPFGPGKPGAL